MFSVAGRVHMEGDSEESEEDVQEEDKPTVLWERCIEQSIIVDLSEDESLHLSDLESSLALHLSQAESATSEASIHLNGKSLFWFFYLVFYWLVKPFLVFVVCR